MKHAIENAEGAWLGATIILRSDYVDDLFGLCLEALEKRWIRPSLFASLRYGKAIEAIPSERVGYLFRLLDEINTAESLHLVVELLDSMKFDGSFPCDSGFVFGVVLKTMPGADRPEQMRGYHWKHVCSKLIEWEPVRATPLLDALLTAMGRDYRLSYNSDAVPLADELVRIDAGAAWGVVKVQFENSLPQWRSDLFSWLKGGLTSFDEEEAEGAIADLPVPEIIDWIEQDVESRAALMARAAPGTLSDDHGGQLTRELLTRYGEIDGVWSGIGATFHSGAIADLILPVIGRDEIVL